MENALYGILTLFFLVSLGALAVAMLFGGRVFAWADTVGAFSFRVFALGGLALVIYQLGSCAILGIKDDLIEPAMDQGSFPFYLAGAVGFILLFVSLRAKNTIVGGLGAALVAAAFSHWIGPIGLKDFLPGK